MIGDASRNRRAGAESLVLPTEVVVGEVQRDRGGVVVDLLAESIGQAGKAPHPHPHREIGTLDVRRAYVLRVGVAGDPLPDAPDTDRGAVPRIGATVGR